MKQSKFKLLLAICALGMILPVFAAKVKIAENGEAVSRIVIEPDSSVAVQHAARELQNYFRLISTARVSIMNALPGGWKTSAVVLVLTDSPLAQKIVTPKMKKQLEGTDGYAVKVSKRFIYIIASRPRGLINGVHRLIFKHTDFIWVRPLKEMCVFTPDPNLTLDVKDYIDLPEFKFRFMGGNRHISYTHEEYEMFLSRVCNNVANSVFPDAYTRRAELDMRIEYGGGHNLGTLWLPKRIYGQTHPEYYMMVKGERVTQGRVQLCYTNRDMWKTFIDCALKKIATLPSYYTCVNMMIEDTPACCECPECLKPITLPDGKVLSPGDESFRSTQFYLFLNAVAEAVHAKYPKLEIKTFGYFFTAIPPAIPIHPSICINFCPYVRDDKQTLHGPANAKWLERTDKYAEMSKNLIWREYYYCSGGYFPRPLANVVAQDLRYINKLGIRRIYVEAGVADKPGPARSLGCTENEIFSMTGPEFWTINQLMWDPRQDPNWLREEYLRRTYREAAPAVIRFFNLIRDVWLDDPTPAAFNDDFRRGMGTYIIAKNLTKPCQDALAEAAKLVKDPRSKIHLEMLTATFNRWLTLADSVKVESQKVPKVPGHEFPDFDFDSGRWKKAAALSPFRAMGRPELPAKYQTEVKLMHNGDTLFVAYRCTVPGEPVGKQNLKKDAFPGGDHGEIFIANAKDGYYHLAFNCFGGHYDARCTEPAWNAEWEVRTQRKENEWRAVAAIPFKSVNLSIEQNNKVRALFYTQIAPRSTAEHSINTAWCGGRVHSVGSFGELVFDLE